MDDKVDVLVVGAGVVGLAIARAFALSGKEVVITESQSNYGTGTSARNSGVIHAGIYYPTGSKKAQWCVRGRHLLYEYARAHHVGHQQLGKLIVARAPEAARLESLFQTGLANGVDDLQLISGSQARGLEPALSCDMAVLSPSTGIIDAHELMHALLGDAERHGAMLAVESRFVGAECVQGVWHSDVGGTIVKSEILINAAGLDAIPVAHAIAGTPAEQVPVMQFAKGNYARLMGKCPFSRLIYPVPVPGGLGTHLTIDLGGQANFGPDVEWLPQPTAEQTAQGLISSFSYQVDELRIQGFDTDIRRWWPDLPAGALAPGYSGIRPKLVGPTDPAADYCVLTPAQHGLPGLVHLLGMESPALTSCLAIAQAVTESV
jgi:L-2-hydroxyglutarate oxidase LhgO